MRFLRLGCAAAALASAISGAGAAQSSANFDVHVVLQAPNTSGPGLCSSSTQSGALGLNVKVVCPPGDGEQPPDGDGQGSKTPRGLYRFKIPGASGEALGTVDIYSGAGTVTSWRMINLTNWEYLEMTVGW